MSDPAQGGLSLYSVNMPETSFGPCNIQHYDFSRTTQNGAGILIVDVWLIEIRKTVEAGFSNTQQPSGADPVNGGAVQTQAPTSAQAAVLIT